MSTADRMSNPKTEVEAVLDALPENSSFQEIRDRLSALWKRHGADAAEAGNMPAHEAGDGDGASAATPIAMARLDPPPLDSFA